jgi:hypothetical protein
MKQIFRISKSVKGNCSINSNPIERMKILFLCLFNLITWTISGQKDSSHSKIIAPLAQYIQVMEGRYNCNIHIDTHTSQAQMISPQSFNEASKTIFSKVIVDNDDIVKKGKAINYTQNTDKNTISFSSIFIGKKGHLMYGINANGNSQDNLLSLKNSTSPNYGLAAGGAVFWKLFSIQDFESDDCYKLQSKRQDYYYELLSNYKGLDLLLSGDKAQTSLKIDSLNNRIAVLNKNTQYAYYSTYKRLDIRKLIKERDSLVKLQNSYNLFYEHGIGALKDTIDQSITSWELKNSNFVGNMLLWIDGGVDLSYNAINVYDVSVLKTMKPIKQTINKTAMYVAGNFSMNTRKIIFYVNLGVKFYNSYWLEGQHLKNYELKDTTYNETIKFQAYNNLSANKSLSNMYYTTNPYLTAYIFPYQKTLGIETSVSLKIQPQSAPLYDARLGVLYSVHDEKTDLAVGTFGLFFTLNGYDSSTKLNQDKIGIGFRVGLPLDKLMKAGK